MFPQPPNVPNEQRGLETYNLVNVELNMTIFPKPPVCVLFHLEENNDTLGKHMHASSQNSITPNINDHFSVLKTSNKKEWGVFV